MLDYNKTLKTVDLVSQTLSCYFKQNIGYCQDSDGTPYLTGCDMHISLSHSHKALVFAISHLPVGIDIEYNTPRNYLKISAKLGFHCSDLNSFYLEWTAYEARFKAKDITLPIRYLPLFNGYTLAIAGDDKITQLINILK